MFINNLFLGLTFLIVYTFLIAGIGTIVVKKSKCFSENVYLILPTGFIVFFSLSFFVYLPFIFANSNLIVLASIELIKDVLIIYYIFYSIRPYLWTWLKSLWRHILIIFFVAGAFLLVLWLSINPSDASDQMDFIGWLKFNGKQFTIQSYDWFTGSKTSDYGANFFSQTWYHFNLVLYIGLSLNANILAFWLDGMVILMFGLSTLMAFFTIFTQKKEILKYLASFSIMAILVIIGNNKLPAIVGFQGLMFTFILLIVFFIYYAKFDNRNLLFWMNFTFIVGWSFDYSALFIWGFFYYSFFVYMLFAKKQSIIQTFLTLLLPTTFLFGMNFFISSPFIFAISLIACGAIVIIDYSTNFWNYKILKNSDDWLHKKKLIFLIIPILLFFIVSIVFFVNGRTNSWLDFSPYSNGLQRLGSIPSSLDVWFTYAIYWIFMVFVCVFAFWKLNFFSKQHPLIFTTFLTGILFFNPLVSGFVDEIIVNDLIYYGVGLSFMLPVVLVLTSIAIQKINKNWMMMFGNLGAMASIMVPVAMNIEEISTNSFENPTAKKGIENVAQLLNSFNIPLGVYIDGDVKGLRALTTIPFSNHTQDGPLFYNFINLPWFDSHPNYNFSDTNTSPNYGPYILIKLNINVDHDFNTKRLISKGNPLQYESVGFVNFYSIDNYFIYTPF